MTRTPRRANGKGKAKRASPWAVVGVVQGMLAEGGSLVPLWKTFEQDDADVFLELTRDQQLRLLGTSEASPHRRSFVEAIEAVACEWATGDRPRDSLSLYDALLEVKELDLSTYCNALWAVQDDNVHLGVDEPRARRYLAACLPHGEANPPIFYNACCVLTELNDVEGALAQLREAVAHGHDTDAMAKEIWNAPMFAPLRSDGRWVEVLETTKPKRKGRR
jgi:hypothetical protein